MGKYSKFRNIVVLGIVLFLSLVLSVGLANAGGDGFISFKLDGKVYKFSDVAVGGWSLSRGFTAVGAFDSSSEKFILLAFEGKSKGIYSISLEHLYNQIQYQDTKNKVWLVAIGDFGSGVIKVNKYGRVGRPITGTFSGTITDELFGGSGKHPISGKFKVVRVQDTDTSLKTAPNNSEITNEIEFLKQIVEDTAESVRRME